jgi:hypothetical protein
LLGFCSKSSGLSLEGLDDPEPVAFAAGITPLPDEEEIGTDEAGTEAAPSEPRSRKDSSFKLTEVDLMYLCKSAEDRLVDVLAIANDVVDVEVIESDRTSNTEDAFSEVIENGETVKRVRGLALAYNRIR